jgi:diguanylate cyclase (GGDEF)-like protein
MERNEKASKTIDFSQAKIASTYKDINRQIQDNNDLVARLTRRLQTSLNIADLISTFTEELSALFDFGQFRYEPPHGKLISAGNGGGAHSCQFNLALESFKLGHIKISRRTRFTEDEISIIEFLASTLVFPLRNALMYQEALENALTDELTGCGNKRALQASLHREADRAIRHRKPLSILMIDIDHFKAINDRLGHLAGDEILKQLSGVLSSHFRKSDLCFRYGGEEFLIILDESDTQHSMQVAERLRALIATEHFVVENQRVPMSISLGQASFHYEETLDTLIQRADKALYEAKKTGRNAVVSAEKTLIQQEA